MRVSPNKFYRQGIDTPEQLEDGFPTTRAELFGYDALIIGSVEAASLSTGQQQLIRDFVSERGGSLLMLAGPAGLGNGGWGQSEIADVLPARLPPTSTDTFHRKKAGVVLMPQGAGAQMLKFDADADNNRDAWQSLPEIADYQLLGGPETGGAYAAQCRHRTRSGTVVRGPAVRSRQRLDPRDGRHLAMADEHAARGHEA